MTAAIDQALARLELADAIVIKALKVSELTQMARIETRLREFMHAKWNARAKKAIGRAAKLAEKGKSVEAVVDAIDKVMQPWPNDVVPKYKQSVRSIYKLARVVAWKRGTGQIKGKKALTFTTENFSDGQTVIKAIGDEAAELFPGFDVADEAAIQHLNGHNTFWVGNHYSANVSASIAETVRDTMVAAGTSRTVAAAALRTVLKRQFGIVNVPNGFTGSSKSYFEGLAANSSTVARVTGQVRTFDELDVLELEVVNPMDKRTSQQCQHMNGKVFTVQQAKAQVDAELAASDPNDVKAIHPWVGMPAMKTVSPKAGFQGKADAEALANSGIILPPYHFRCRTTVDIR